MDIISAGCVAFFWVANATRNEKSCLQFLIPTAVFPMLPHTENVFHIASRLCETTPSPPAPDPVAIENCKQLFSPLLAFTTQKIAIHDTDIIFAVCVAFFWVVNASHNEKSCSQFLIPTAVFHIFYRFVSKDMN